VKDKINVDNKQESELVTNSKKRNKIEEITNIEHTNKDKEEEK
jgi:hypothetical protein